MLLLISIFAKLRMCSPQVHTYRLAELVGERIDAGGYPALLGECECTLGPRRCEADAAHKSELLAWQTEMGFGVGVQRATHEVLEEAAAFRVGEVAAGRDIEFDATRRDCRLML